MAIPELTDPVSMRSAPITDICIPFAPLSIVFQSGPHLPAPFHCSWEYVWPLSARKVCKSQSKGYNLV